MSHEYCDPALCRPRLARQTTMCGRLSRQAEDVSFRLRKRYILIVLLVGTHSLCCYSTGGAAGVGAAGGAPDGGADHLEADAALPRGRHLLRPVRATPSVLCI